MIFLQFTRYSTRYQRKISRKLRIFGSGHLLLFTSKWNATSTTLVKYRRPISETTILIERFENVASQHRVWRCNIACILIRKKKFHKSLLISNGDSMLAKILTGIQNCGNLQDIPFKRTKLHSVPIKLNTLYEWK